MDRMPRARKEDLVVVELAGEMLVYDLKSNKMHRLNEAAATVWQSCDGRHKVDTVAAALATRASLPEDVQLVEMTVQRLADARLLEGNPRLETRISRRDLLRRLGLSAAAAPLIASLVAPQAAQAASCIPKNGDCTGNPNGCCPGCTCSGGNPKCHGGC